MFNRIVTFKRALIGTYLGLGAFLLAHTVNAFVADALRPLAVQVSRPDPIKSSEPAPPSPREIADAILARGLFPLPAVDVTPESASGSSSPPLNVGKKLALLGTVFGPHGGVMAIFEEVSTKKQSLYHRGELVPTVGTLATIQRDRVLFQEGHQEEWLDLALTQQPQVRAPGAESQAGVPPPSGSQLRVLDRRELDTTLADTTRLLTQAQAVPYLADGKLAGLRLYSVMPLGFFDKIGFRTNDLLQRINGVALRDPGMLLSLFQQLRNERTIRVDLVRNGERQTLAYEIR